MRYGCAPRACSLCRLLGLILGLYAPTGHAGLPGNCEKLGAALVEHSCFHAVLGPFTQVEAHRGITAPGSAPKVDAVHTYYDVILPEPLGENTVSYQVASGARAGVWAVFLDPEIPLRVIDEAGRELPVLLEVATPDCKALPRAVAYELETQRYRFVLGPATTTHGLLVIENISDFLTFNGVDRDGDGYGDPNETIETPCVPPSGYVPNDGDCDDMDPNVHPGVAELCDGVDQNCNGLADDEGLPCEMGVGRCKARGAAVCTGGEHSVCEAETALPEAETCNGIDDDCDGTEDLKEAGLCNAEEDAPRCVRVLGEVRCGCDGDQDCGGSQSGRVCNLETRRCESGCVALAGRNGCTPPEVCTSADPAHVGHCAVLAGEASQAGNAPANDDGCGCRVPGRATQQRCWTCWQAALLLGLAALRRRYKRRIS